MKELKRAIWAFSMDLNELQSLPAEIQQLQRAIAAPSHIGPIDFSRALKDLRRQAAASAAEAQALAASMEETATLQDLLERFAGVYQQQRAAIAALETHLRAYGYSAECPCHAPADPLAALQSAQQSPVSSGDKAGSAGSPAGGAGDAAAALGRSSDSSHAAAAIAEDKASAAGWADAAHRMACTATPADDSAALAPKGAGTSEAAAGLSPTSPTHAEPLATVTNLPPASAVRPAAKPAASPSAASTSSGTPFSVSPSLRKLQQKYAARPAAADSPPEDLLPLPPRLLSGTPAAAHTAVLQHKQQSSGGIGRWQSRKPAAQVAPQTAMLAVSAAGIPVARESQQRPRPTVRFTGVRSVSRSPADEPLHPAAQQHQQGFAQQELGRRASVYGYAGVSTGGGTAAAAAAALHDDPGRRASMYAAVDTAAASSRHGDASSAVGPPGTWATSAELRSAQAHAGASDPGLGPVTPAPAAAPDSTQAGAAHGAVLSECGGVATALLPHRQAQQPSAVDEESTMELYSQLIRCRRSPEPQPATPDATAAPGQPGFCYTPITCGAPAAISPDTVSLLSRAFEPTSVTKGARPTVSIHPAAAAVGVQPAQRAAASGGAASGAADAAEQDDAQPDEEFSIRLPAASVAFARAGGVRPAPALQPAVPAAAVPAPAALPQVSGAGASAAARNGAPQRSQQHPQKPQPTAAKPRESPTAPEPGPRAAAVLASFAAQKAAQVAGASAMPLRSGCSEGGGAASITAEEYGGLPPYIRSQIGLAALDAALRAAAGAAGGFTADTLQGAAGSAKAARAAVNCLMKLGRARCEVKNGQMVYHLRS